MKSVLKSIFGLGGDKPAEAAAPATDEITQEELDMAARVPSHKPVKPVRQMVDPVDIPPPGPVPAVLDALDDEPSAAEVSDPELEAKVLEAIKVVRDPEIPVNLVDLGLIYTLVVSKEGRVFVEMTLTTPHCPSAAELPNQVRDAALGVEGVSEAKVKVVFEPPWHQGLMSEEAQLELGMF
jgi:FeS assembly SUF system protein